MTMFTVMCKPRGTKLSVDSKIIFIFRIHTQWALRELRLINALQSHCREPQRVSVVPGAGKFQIERSEFVIALKL